MPLVIIAGHPCSGKSTVAAVLCDALTAAGQTVQLVSENQLFLNRNDLSRLLYVHNWFPIPGCGARFYHDASACLGTQSSHQLDTTSTAKQSTADRQNHESQSYRRPDCLLAAR
jgi:energy-coupling factor transporter ATP-binding protein EcfA2